jgi:hypothetical protein
MAETPQDTRARFAKRNRFLWLLGFVGAAVAVAVLFPGKSGSGAPIVTLPDGSTVKFVAITHLHRPTPGSVRERTRIRLGHEEPIDEVEGWWTSRYREWWLKSPGWLRARFPQPRFLATYNGKVSFGRRDPLYKFWLLASSPHFSVHHWTFAINGAACASQSMRVGGTSGPVWVDVDSDYAFPSDMEQVRLRITKRDGSQTWVMEIENPFYRPKK